MKKTNTMKLRLALRAEGDYWVAYLAEPGTMKGARELGRLLIGATTHNPQVKQGFMDLMQLMVGDAIRAVTGEVVDWPEPEPAPESERSGHA